MSRLDRFEDFQFIGTRDAMIAYDCDDPGQYEELVSRVDSEGLLALNLLQSFAPDTLDEARNRGFRPR